MQNKGWNSLYYAMLASAKISQGANQQFFAPAPLFQGIAGRLRKIHDLQITHHYYRRNHRQNLL
jgi:hypothetical protein